MAVMDDAQSRSIKPSNTPALYRWTPPTRPPWKRGWIWANAPQIHHQKREDLVGARV